MTVDTSNRSYSCRSCSHLSGTPRLLRSERKSFETATGHERSERKPVLVVVDVQTASSSNTRNPSYQLSPTSSADGRQHAVTWSSPVTSTIPTAHSKDCRAGPEWPTGRKTKSSPSWHSSQPPHARCRQVHLHVIHTRRNPPHQRTRLDRPLRMRHRHQRLCPQNRRLCLRAQPHAMDPQRRVRQPRRARNSCRWVTHRQEIHRRESDNPNRQPPRICLAPD